MSLDRSLKGANALVRHRNVLTRDERLAKLKEAEKWTEQKSVFGLPKVANRKLVVGGKGAKEEVAEGAAGAVAGATATATGAAPAAGAAGAKAGATGGAKAGTAPAKGAATPAKGATPAKPGAATGAAAPSKGKK
jgi:small basic protein (TIGR04137 family)